MFNSAAESWVDSWVNGFCCHELIRIHVCKFRLRQSWFDSMFWKCTWIRVESTQLGTLVSWVTSLNGWPDSPMWCDTWGSVDREPLSQELIQLTFQRSLWVKSWVDSTFWKRCLFRINKNLNRTQVCNLQTYNLQYTYGSSCVACLTTTEMVKVSHATLPNIFFFN